MPSFPGCVAPGLAGCSGRPGERPLLTEAPGGPGGSGPSLPCHRPRLRARRLRPDRPTPAPQPHASRGQTLYLQVTRLTEAPYIVSRTEVALVDVSGTDAQLCASFPPSWQRVTSATS